MKLQSVHFLLANVFATDFARGIVRIAIGWLVLQEHGGSGLSLFVLISSLGQFFGSIVAGHITDTLDRRRVAGSSTLIGGLAIAGLGYFCMQHSDLLLPICLLSAVTHFLLSVQDNAVRTLIPFAVENTGIERTNAHFITVGEFGFFVAPLIAGWWTTYYGAHGVLFATSAVAVLGAAAILRVTILTVTAAHSTSEDVGGERPQVRVFRHRWLIVGLALAALANLLLVPISYVLVPIEIKTSGFTAIELGYFYAAMSLGLACAGLVKADGFGSALGSLRLPTFLATAALVYASTLVFEYLAAVLLCGLLAGFFLAKFEITWNSIIQTRSPKRLLGRIYALASWSSFAARSIGVFLIGLIVTDSNATTIILSLIALILVCLFFVVLTQGRVRQTGTADAPANPENTS